MLPSASSVKSGFKKYLLVSAALGGLVGITQAAQAQLIGLEGLVGKHADGGVGELVIPLFQSPVGMLYTSIQGGQYDGEKVASFDVGYRAVMGDWLVGGYVGGDVQGFRQDKRLWGVTVGGEVLVGNLGFSANFYQPVSKDRKIKGTGYQPNLGLHDQPGSHDCTQPDSTNSRTCVLNIQGKGESKRTAYQGGDGLVSYRLPFFGTGVDIVPQVGGYIFENDIKGVQGGVEVNISLGGGLMLTGGGKATHDRRGTEARMHLGLQYNFGGAAASSTYLQRQFNQAPRRFQPGMVHGVKEGKEYGQQALTLQGPGGKPITIVQFVDASNQGNAANKVANIGEGGMVIFSGNIQAPIGTSIEVKQNNVALVGGNATLALTGVVDGKSYSYTTPGNRPAIRQADVNTPVFLVDGRNNTYFQGLDLEGGSNAWRILNTSGTVVRDVKTNLAFREAFYFEKTTNDQLSYITVLNAGFASAPAIVFTLSKGSSLQDFVVESSGREGLSVIASADIRIDNGTIRNAGLNGLSISAAMGVKSQNIQISNILIDKANGNGMQIVDTNNSIFYNITINNSFQNGILITSTQQVTLDGIHINKTRIEGIISDRLMHGNDHLTLKNSEIRDAGSVGIFLASDKNVTLDNVQVIGGSKMDFGVGAFGIGAGPFTFRNVHVENANKTAYELTGVSLIDGTGNTAVKVGKVCDMIINTTGSILVNGTDKCQ